jgi:hypothetical protein
MHYAKHYKIDVFNYVTLVSGFNLYTIAHMGDLELKPSSFLNGFFMGLFFAEMPV